MRLDYNCLWDKNNKVHIITYNKNIFDPNKIGELPRKLIEETGKFLEFNQGYKICGSLAIYSQININRYIADVDIAIDENNFLEIVKIAMDKDYSFCRLAQRELRAGIRTCIFEEISAEQFLQRRPSVRTVLLNRSVRDKYKPTDIVDVFVNYVSKEGWENTSDHRFNPIIPTKFPIEVTLNFENGNVKVASLEYMAVIKSILIENEEIFGIGNKVDREKNKFDLQNILENVGINFSNELKEILKERLKKA
ncbi:MAG: hypothetical protein AB7V77_01850 [Candidatus Woesearchaeota archaeon]